MEDCRVQACARLTVKQGEPPYSGVFSQPKAESAGMVGKTGAMTDTVRNKEHKNKKTEKHNYVCERACLCI